MHIKLQRAKCIVYGLSVLYTSSTYFVWAKCILYDEDRLEIERDVGGFTQREN